MIKVSVLILAYKHEKYIRQALDSILSQKVNFEYEIVIGEDCSPDGTRKICEAYAQKYAQIKLLAHPKNVGMAENEMRTLKQCTGTYIAFCEGDDYWIDDYKLQKQADFLDTHEDFTMCFAAVDVVNETGAKVDNLFKPLEREVYTIDDVISPNYFIPTPTLFFRNILPDPMPPYHRQTLNGDLSMHLLLTDKGKAKYFKEKMGVYRNNGNSLTKTPEFVARTHRSQFDLYDNFNVYTNFKYHDKIKKLIFPAAKTILVYESSFLKGKERRKHIFRMLRAYARYKDPGNYRELLYFILVLFFPFVTKTYGSLKSSVKKRDK